MRPFALLVRATEHPDDVAGMMLVLCANLDEAKTQARQELASRPEYVAIEVMERPDRWLEIRRTAESEVSSV